MMPIDKLNARSAVMFRVLEALNSGNLSLEDRVDIIEEIAEVLEATVKQLNPTEHPDDE